MEFARVDAALTHPHFLCADANGWFIGSLVDVLNGEDAFWYSAALARRGGCVCAVEEPSGGVSPE